MLHDRHRWLGKALYHSPRRISVQQVIERQLLARELDGIQHPGFRLTRSEASICRGPLVSILAVAQMTDALAREAELLGERRVFNVTAAQVLGDYGVVRGDVGERLGCKGPAPLGGHGAGAKFVHDHRVVGWVGENGNARKILCGCPDHCRPADVDLLDRLIHANPRVSNGFAKWVEVGHDQIDRWNPMRSELFEMGCVVTTRKQPGVDAWMERLDAPIQQFRKTGDIRYGRHLHAGSRQLLVGAACGDDLKAQVRQGLGQFDNTGLIENAEERAHSAEKPFGGDRRGIRTMSQDARIIPERLEGPMGERVAIRVDPYDRRRRKSAASVRSSGVERLHHLSSRPVTAAARSSTPPARVSARISQWTGRIRRSRNAVGRRSTP